MGQSSVTAADLEVRRGDPRRVAARLLKIGEEGR
jgi:hypothetical protein